MCFLDYVICSSALQLAATSSSYLCKCTKKTKYTSDSTFDEFGQVLSSYGFNYHGTQASLRSARQVEDIPKHNVLVVPMIKDLFLVGLLVAEHASIDPGSIWSPGKEVEQSSSALGMKREKIDPFQQDKQMTLPSSFTTEQKAQAIKIACTLAVAYVMDQRALLLQQTSWQKGVRMTNLMEQIHEPLSNIRTKQNANTTSEEK